MNRHVDTSSWRVPKHPGLLLWRRGARWSGLLAILAGALSWYTSLQSVKLPPTSLLHPDVLRAPVQSESSMPDFVFTWSGTEYDVMPKADYELAGLVVSHNNVGGIGDIYHDADAVDLKDFCVVWGSSAEKGLYLNGEFSSAPWQCFYQQDRGKEPVALDEFSNNHMLSGTDIITKKIRATRVGDQIRFRGALVQYQEVGATAEPRGTSLVRDDTGDGACEVVFATEFTILRAANTEWRRVESVSWSTVWLCAAFSLVSWVVLPYLSYRWE